MQITELERKSMFSGETISTYDVGNTKIILTTVFGNQITLEEVIFKIACQKISGKVREVPRKLDLQEVSWYN